MCSLTLNIDHVPKYPRMFFFRVFLASAIHGHGHILGAMQQQAHFGTSTALHALEKRQP